MPYIKEQWNKKYWKTKQLNYTNRDLNTVFSQDIDEALDASSFNHIKQYLYKTLKDNESKTGKQWFALKYRNNVSELFYKDRNLQLWSIYEEADEDNKDTILNWVSLWDVALVPEYREALDLLWIEKWISFKISDYICIDDCIQYLWKNYIDTENISPDKINEINSWLKEIWSPYKVVWSWWSLYVVAEWTFEKKWVIDKSNEFLTTFYKILEVLW